MTSTTRALAICLLFAGTGCSSQKSADVTTTSALTVPTTFPASTPVETVPEVIATTVPGVATTAPAVVQLLSASYGCGPADGPWVEATVLSAVGRTVFGEIWLDGQAYGRSDPVVVQPGVQAAIGFDPATPSEAFGSTAVLRIAASEGPSSPLVTGEVVLKVPAGVSCG